MKFFSPLPYECPRCVSQKALPFFVLLSRGPDLKKKNKTIVHPVSAIWYVNCPIFIFYVKTLDFKIVFNYSVCKFLWNTGRGREIYWTDTFIGSCFLDHLEYNFKKHWYSELECDFKFRFLLLLFAPKLPRS